MALKATCTTVSLQKLVLTQRLIKGQQVHESHRLRPFTYAHPSLPVIWQRDPPLSKERDNDSRNRQAASPHPTTKHQFVVGTRSS